MIGPTEVAIIGGVVVLLFGGKKFAELGKGVGEGLSGFRKGIREANEAEKEIKELPKGD